jgi:hypothetical protein
MVDLTPLLQAVIALIASLITLKVIPWIKARTSLQQQVLLRSTTEILVYAAEQIYGSGRGQEKLNFVEDELERRGYQVDTAAIEASVRSMNLESGWIQMQSEKTC